MEGGIPRPLCPLIQEEFCRIGSEAIFNALRHAKANRIQVEVDYGRRFFRLICRDDGIGIPDEVVQASGKNGHWGLKGMQERAQSIGAKFRLWTGAGQGTEIDVRLRSRLAYDHTSYLDRISSLFRRSASEPPPRS
jgi:signal transduction histidine kinase